jgi:hypothetical protein
MRVFSHTLLLRSQLVLLLSKFSELWKFMSALSRVHEIETGHFTQICVPMKFPKEGYFKLPVTVIISVVAFE